MKRFQLSVESLETRETPAGLASVTDLVIDSFNPSASASGPGVYKSVDGGRTWADSSGVSGRVTAIVADPTAATGGTINVYFHVIRNGGGAPGGSDSIWIDVSAPPQTADESARYFNGMVSRNSAGDIVLKGSKIGENALVGANESITIDGAQVESVRRHQVTLTSFDVGTPRGSVYTVTFGGSLVG